MQPAGFLAQGLSEHHMVPKQGQGGPGEPRNPGGAWALYIPGLHGTTHVWTWIQWPETAPAILSSTQEPQMQGHLLWDIFVCVLVFLNNYDWNLLLIHW